ncbi:MAG: hypothetical protein ACK5BN_15385, partial [Planctomycetota bacterium]
RVYVAETFRIKDGVFDDRDYMQWKDDDLACRTVAERLAKYEKHIKDRIPRFAAYSERVRLLVDTDRNGTLDKATVFAAGFDQLADGIASGVLPVGQDVWFTNIPKLWRLRDADGDGTAEVRDAVHDGYGVHSSLIGHDLHGLVVGPDRRLYFSIGDRGFQLSLRSSCDRPCRRSRRTRPSPSMSTRRLPAAPTAARWARRRASSWQSASPDALRS